MQDSRAADSARIPRILVVDDMPDNLFLMNGLLEDRYEVIQALSGEEALKVVMSARPPDMVLLDIMMPDMDGYEVLRRIRQHPPTANIPVIFLTALASQNDQRLGMNLGALDYLTKPVDPGVVMRRLDAHVRATAHARNVEALSEKLARHMVPESWQRLFQGPGLESIRFEHGERSVLYAETPGMAIHGECERDSFAAEVEWLAVRHGGVVDHYHDGTAVVFFDDAASCVRMAMDLQRSSAELHLRMGIHTGPCELARFTGDHGDSVTLLGEAPVLAANVAASAAAGSIAISPQTYALVRDEINADTAGCLLMEEFHDSDLAHVCLTPTPIRGGEHALSTFAGLGR